MSAHRNKTTFRGIMNHGTRAIAVLPVAFAAAALATPETSASQWEPDSAYQSAQVQSDDWPDEGSGYPGYGGLNPFTPAQARQAGLHASAFARGVGPRARGGPGGPVKGLGTTTPDDWPDEGSGYPGYADQSSPTGTVSNQGLDTTSVALGALGGIALGGAGLGITLGVQRRRDHAALPTA